jgi:hypothetical protein
MDTEIRKLTLDELREKLKLRFSHVGKIDPSADPVPANRKRTDEIRLMEIQHVEADPDSQF